MKQKDKKILSGMLFFAGLFIMIFGIPVFTYNKILASPLFISGFFMIMLGLGISFSLILKEVKVKRKVED